MRLSELAAPHVPSFVAACFKCGAKVWVSELTGRPLIERGGLAICTPCFRRVEGPVEIQDDVQLAEAEAWKRERPMMDRRSASPSLSHTPRDVDTGSSLRRS